MRAVLCKRLDGPEALVIEDVPVAEPGPGEVAVTVRVAALNFFDTLITRGKYQHKPELPFSPAGEIAGVVARVGEGVSGFRPGDRVAAYLGWGGARDEVIVMTEAAIPIPSGVADEAAAGVPITYGTAIHGLKDRANVQPNEWVAVTGAAGGAGLAAIEIAKVLGARVIAVASSEEKLAICRAHGADAVIAYGKEDLKQALRERTGGAGVDVVYDCVGGDAAEPALRALRWNGRFLVVGFASGDIPKFPLNLLLVKGVSVMGVFWGEAVKRDPAGHRANMEFVLRAVADGRLRPHVHGTYPLERIVEAIGVLERREATGKVVVRVSGD
ncbi:MAG: NADPH:quinone oxidoreductase family protein [Hyphomicrobium sp.]|nr:NADPH:quinone oxidoreductase family protein [Hyphomicrobium sp.]